MMRKGEFDHPLLLVTKYINTQLADELKQNGTEFLDRLEIRYQSASSIHFCKREQAQNMCKTPPTKRTFKPAGLKVILYLACVKQPGELKTYRKILQDGVEQRTADWIIERIKELRLLLEDMGKQSQRLIQKENLLAAIR